MSNNQLAVYLNQDIVRERFQDVLGRSNAGAYIASVLLAVASNTALQKCTPISIYGAALQAATLRLSVDPSTGQAYLVPFGDKATLIVGYKGLYDLAIRTGKYRYINVGPIYEGEVVEQDRISGFHKITGACTNKKNVVGYIAAFELFQGYAKTVYWTVEEIDFHGSKYSKSYNNASSLWKTNKEAMRRKTVLRDLIRHWGYMDPGDSSMLDTIEGVDQQDQVIEGEMSGVPEPPEEPPSSFIPVDASGKTEQQLLAEMGF